MEKRPKNFKYAAIQEESALIFVDDVVENDGAASKPLSLFCVNDFWHLSLCLILMSSDTAQNSHDTHTHTQLWDTTKRKIFSHLKELSVETKERVMFNWKLDDFLIDITNSHCIVHWMNKNLIKFIWIFRIFLVIEWVMPSFPHDRQWTIEHSSFVCGKIHVNANNLAFFPITIVFFYFTLKNECN